MFLKLKPLLSVFLSLAFVYVGAQAPGIKEGFREAVSKYSLVNRPQMPYQNENVNSCNTWTFQLELNSSKSENPRDIVTLPTSSFIISGDNSSTSGKNGRLIKLDHRGSIIISKDITLNENDVTLIKLKYFSDGHVYALGEMTDRGSFVPTPFLLKIDTTDLHIISSIQLLLPNSGNCTGIDLDEGRDNSLSILLSNDSLINVSKLTLNGNILWSKSFRTKNKPAPIGIGNDYFYVYVSYNETDSGFKKSAVMSLDFQTGDLKSSYKIGGAADSSEYILQSIRMINSRPRFTGIEVKKNIYSLIRISASANDGFYAKEVYALGSFKVDDGLQTSQSNWSEVLAAGSKSNNQSIFLAFTYPDNWMSPITSKKLSYAYPISLQKVIRTNDGGSLIMSTGSGTLDKIILTKVDSIGMLPGCGSETIPASFNIDRVVVSKETTQFLPIPLSIKSFILSENDFTLNLTEECRTLFCPDIPEPDSCLRTFFKEYRTSTNSNLASQILTTNSRQLLVIGRERPTPYIADEVPSIILFDTAGKVLDSKLLLSSSRLEFSKVIKLHDGNFLATGYVYYTYDSIEPYIMKLDEKFNILWQKKMFTPQFYRNIADVIESKEGDIYCYIADNLKSLKERRHLLKLNSKGDPIWFKEYDAGPNYFLGSTEFNAALVELGDFIYLKYNEESEDLSPHLIKISKTDGTIIWIKEFKMDVNILGGSQFNLFSFITDNTNLYISGRAYSKDILMKISPDGELIHSLKASNDFINITKLVNKGTDKLIGSVAVSGYGGHTIYGVIEMDTAFKILRKQFLQIPKAGAIYDIQIFSDSVNYAVGNFFYQNPYWASMSLQKYNFNSSFASCAVTDPAISFENLTIPVIPKSSSVFNISLPQTMSYNGSFFNGSTSYSNYWCGNNQLCNSIQINGPSIICDSVNNYRFYTKRNAGCNGIVNWEIDTSANQVQIVSLSDSVLNLKIKTAGTFRVKAKIFGSCSWIGDSITVQATINPSLILNLGPDTTLCERNTLLLNAHSGFSSYLWQDGSVDSVYNVTKPGVYSVTVNGGCGAVFKDTIRVTAKSPAIFDIGNDLSICKGDTVTLHAPEKFINYQWTPAYNITNENSAATNVYPYTNTTYYLKTEVAPGCFGYDSIEIRVKNVTPIILGNDTSFCYGQSIQLDAGQGFDNYEWSTGEVTQKIQINQPGLFKVNAFLDGCASSDSIRILNVIPLPIVSLGNDTILCDQQQLQFSFTLEEAIYSWNTGSTSNNLTIKEPGIYWLKISQQGCSASDTIRVTYLPSPIVNLGNDTTLCEGSSMLITSFNSNATYLWQDGSNEPDYLIKDKGTYYVTVAINGCKASDTINVSLSPLPSFSLGEDVFLCIGQSLNLHPLMNTEVNYLWQDGSSAPFYKITSEGNYFLKAYNACGSFTDTIKITTGICALSMPSAFTPNNDGINDVFRVKYVFPVKNFTMQIYDRWGEKVFETTDIYQGWDGKYKGNIATQGTYVWVIRLETPEGKMQNEKGLITVLR